MSVDRDRPRLDDDVLARAHPVVGPLAVDLDRRDRRRHLQDVAPESLQRDLDGLLGDLGRGGAGEQVALGVISDRRLTEPDGGDVRLLGEQQVAEQPGGAAVAEDQHTRRHRVEGAGVADLAGAEAPPGARHHVVGGDPARLVDDDQPGGRGHQSSSSSRSSSTCGFLYGIRLAGVRRSAGRRRSGSVGLAHPLEELLDLRARSPGARRGGTPGSAPCACRAACRPRSGSGPWPTRVRPPSRPGRRPRRARCRRSRPAGCRRTGVRR